MHLTTISNLNLYNLCIFFTIYSFLGWCTEVMYYFKVERKFVNRGFLYGPFCPIYGFGLIALILILDNFKESNLFILFLIATFVTSFLEYFTGLFLEKTFKSKWWDYTEDPFNLHGRICLLYSLIWGVASVAVVKLFHPLITKLLLYIPDFLDDILFFTVVIYFAVDFTFTILSLIKFKNILLYIQEELMTKLPEKPGNLINSTKEKAAEAGKIIETILSKLKLTLNHIRLMEAFPNMSSKSFDYVLKILRDKFNKN